MARDAGYHRAYMGQAATELARGYECACGCEAVPSVEDRARDLWVQSLVGSVPRQVNLTRGGAVQHRAALEPKEQTTQGACPKCRKPMELLTYLADALKLRGAKWPECERCRQPREEPTQEAWWDK